MSDLAEIIRRAAARYGVDPEYMLRTAQMESGMNPAAANPNSSARGLFQFIAPTWAQYGRGDPTDPMASADAAARFAADNAGYFRRTMGRAASPGEMYLMHQQGPGGAVKLLQNPDAPAASLVGMNAVAHNAGRDGATAKDFANQWISRFGGAIPATGPASGAPTTAEIPSTSMASREAEADTNPVTNALQNAALMFAQLNQGPQIRRRTKKPLSYLS